MLARTACQPFLALMLPRKGQSFLPERRNCNHTFRGVLHFRLPSALQRYNTLDFPRKIVCQQGCYSPLLETQSQRGSTPLWIPHLSVQQQSILYLHVGYALARTGKAGTEICLGGGQVSMPVYLANIARGCNNFLFMMTYFSIICLNNV